MSTSGEPQVPKHVTWSIALPLAIIAVIAMIVFAFLVIDAAQPETEKAQERFSWSPPCTLYYQTSILTDNVTGVQYLVVLNSDGVAITPLLPKPSDSKIKMPPGTR